MTYINNIDDDFFNSNEIYIFVVINCMIRKNIMIAKSVYSKSSFFMCLSFFLIFSSMHDPAYDPIAAPKQKTNILK